MARPVSTNNATMQLHLSQDQKAKLASLADYYGSTSVSAFVAAIADGKFKVLHTETVKYLQYLERVFPNPNT